MKRSKAVRLLDEIEYECDRDSALDGTGAWPTVPKGFQPLSVGQSQHPINELAQEFDESSIVAIAHEDVIVRWCATTRMLRAGKGLLRP